MELVCLAAGLGTRMGRLGTYLQKCMYPVGLKPFLELSLEEAAAVGGERVHLVVGHLQEQVRAYFGTACCGMSIVYVEQERQLGTGHALGLVAPHLAGSDGPVLVWQADVYAPRELLRALLEHPARTALSLVHEPEAPPEVLVEVRDERVVRAWRGAGPLSDGGVWKLEPWSVGALAEEAEANGEYRVLPNLQRLLEEGATEVGFVNQGRRLHLGGTHPSAEANVARVVRELLARAVAT